MLISMQEAIARTIDYQTRNKINCSLYSTNAYWRGKLVSDVLEKQTVKELLVAYGGQAPIKFDDSLEGEALDKAIDAHVVCALQYMIDDDFRVPGADGTVFSAIEVRQLLNQHPNLIHNLQEYINEFETDLYACYSIREFVPALVALENIKKPGFDLCVGTNEQTLQIIKGWIENGQERGRLIHRQEEPHFLIKEARWIKHSHGCYLDYKLVHGKPSILWVDSYPVTIGHGAFYKLKLQLEALNKDVHLGDVQLHTQNSSSGCHVFALNAAKQIYRDPTCLDHIHEVNCHYRSEGLYADWIIPSRLLKHTQSSKQLMWFMNNTPRPLDEPVNKKGENLWEYRAKHEVQAPGEQYFLMRSIFPKRLAYLKELRESFGVPAVKL